jgi:hypothetical protein
MDSSIVESLSEYYLNQSIHPKKFYCAHQNFCRQYAHLGQMIETKMSLVGSLYGTRYPKIVVVSLDPPGQGDLFLTPARRTTEHISKFTEAENYTVNRPNPHWAMTQIIVKELLTFYGYPILPGAAVVSESYSGRPIENVTPYFAHVNVAKCSMNYPDKRQAPRGVHETCSHAYLLNELKILQPEILVSQGKTTNEIMGVILTGVPIYERQLPVSFSLNLDGRSILWLPMRHPSRQQKLIRQDWPTYKLAIQNMV